MRNAQIINEIKDILDMLTTLNSIGALDGLIFATVRNDDEQPIYGRVCNAGRSFELLGAIHSASFAFADKIDGSSDLVYGNDSRKGDGECE